VHEEAHELKIAGVNEVLGELADLHEVLAALTTALGFTEEQVQRRQPVNAQSAEASVNTSGSTRFGRPVRRERHALISAYPDADCPSRRDAA
jgi:hypothetical protein